LAGAKQLACRHDWKSWALLRRGTRPQSPNLIKSPFSKPAARQKKEGKQFFFEKKNQKTLVC
jgi:hypothetical protein